MANTRILLDDNFALGKRRRENIDDGAAAPSRALSRTGKAPSSMTIKTFDLGYARPRTSLPSPPLDHEDHEQLTSTSCQRQDTPPPAKTRRKVKAAKETAPPTSIPIPTISHQPGQLEACCCCSSKPMRKTDLERYSNCEMCERRTCTVCIRTCHGSCDDRSICKKCSVEQGEEGDSFCLECMNIEEDHEMEG